MTASFLFYWRVPFGLNDFSSLDVKANVMFYIPPPSDGEGNVANTSNRSGGYADCQ